MIKKIKYDRYENEFSIQNNISQNAEPARTLNRVYNNGYGYFMYFDDEKIDDKQAYTIMKSKILEKLNREKLVIENKIKNIANAVQNFPSPKTINLGTIEEINNEV